MTFLELCKELRARCGIQGDGPAAVTGQTGVLDRVVKAVQAAYVEVQLAYPDWAFRWARFEFVTAAGNKDYDPTGTSIDRVVEDSLTCYDTAAGGEAEEWRLDYVPYADWLMAYGMGAPSSGAPAVFTVLPSRTIRLYPTPDADTYRVQGDYYRTPHTLTVGTDAPIIPDAYHLVIVYRAMIAMGGYLGAVEVAQTGMQLYQELLNNLDWRERADTPDYVRVA